MANVNVAYGLKPIGKLGQATNSTGMSEYRIAVANTNPIFQGMAVIPLAAGVIDDLQAAAGGNVAICGVFGGCEYTSSSTGRLVWSNYWPGSGADTAYPVKAFVYDDPNQLFSICTSNVVAGQNTEAEVRTSVFSNIAFATGNTGSTTTGMSSATADLNTVATTNTLALRIMGIVEDPDNADFTVLGIPLIVRINNHFNAPTGSIVAATVSTTGI
tara:strand:- start:6 stop:650 length:645 start_codon:yes stop_codon:yes gene_type:complete